MDAVLVAAHIILTHLAVEDGHASTFPETVIGHVGELQVVTHSQLEASQFIDHTGM